MHIPLLQECNRWPRVACKKWQISAAFEAGLSFNPRISQDSYSGLIDFVYEPFIFSIGLTHLLGDIEMTKYAKVVAVLAVVVALAACSTGRAQSESVVRGDSTFERAQTK